MSDQPIPIFAISDSELARGAVVRVYDLIYCPTCGKPHALYGAGPLLFYDCGEASYLAALDGHLLGEGNLVMRGDRP